MWDYSEKVMDHYRNPRNVGKIDNADAVGEAGSLACGDSLKIYLKIKDGIVTDAKFQTFGCGSAVASSSILTEMIIGKPVDEVRKITNQDIADQLGGLPPEKMHCSVMGYEALEDALQNFDDLTDLDDLREEKVAEKIVCTCFGVTENMIWDAIKHNGLKTVEEITNFTKAGGACGRCQGKIKEILDQRERLWAKRKLSKDENEMHEYAEYGVAAHFLLFLFRNYIKRTHPVNIYKCVILSGAKRSRTFSGRAQKGCASEKKRKAEP